MPALAEVERKGNPPATLALAAALALAACAAPPAAPPHAGETFTAADGTRLPMRTHGADPRPKAILLALHGFNDYSGFIDQPARFFAQAGIETLAYDQRGFGAAPHRGEWAGAQALVGDFRAFVRKARSEHPGVPLYALGHSMGAAVIAVALARDPGTPIDGAILVSPAIWSCDTMPWYQRFGIWIGARLVPGMALSSAQLDIAPTDNPAARAEFARDPYTLKRTRMDTLEGLSDLMDEAIGSVPGIRPRALLLYGMRDAMIPRPPAIALLERRAPEWSPGFRFAAYPDGFHVLLRDLQAGAVWKDIVSWMLRPEAPLPSGFERTRHEMLRRLEAPAP